MWTSGRQTPLVVLSPCFYSHKSILMSSFTSIFAIVVVLYSLIIATSIDAQNTSHKFVSLVDELDQLFANPDKESKAFVARFIRHSSCPSPWRQPCMNLSILLLWFGSSHHIYVIVMTAPEPSRPEVGQSLKLIMVASSVGEIASGAIECSRSNSLPHSVSRVWSSDSADRPVTESVHANLKCSSNHKWRFQMYNVKVTCPMSSLAFVIPFSRYYQI